MLMPRIGIGTGKRQVPGQNGESGAIVRRDLDHRRTLLRLAFSEILAYSGKRVFERRNFGRRLKTLKGLTPYEFICKRWTSEPERFTLDPIHQMPGLSTYQILAGHSLTPFAGYGRLISARRVAPCGIVPSLDELKDRHPCFRLCLELATVEVDVIPANAPDLGWSFP